MTKQLSVIIADGHEVVRDGIAARIEADTAVNVVAKVSDGYSCLKECRQCDPDILILDLSITRPSGSETLMRARKASPRLKILMLSSDASIANAFFCLSQGAVGFMPKQALGADFVNAVRAASNGFTYLPVEFLKEFLQARRNLTRTGNAFGLSPREVEILDACTGGQSNKDIATSLNISVRTVETHRNSIYRKTSCRNFSELTKVVASLGDARRVVGTPRGGAD